MMIALQSDAGKIRIIVHTSEGNNYCEVRQIGTGEHHDKP
jgi:hypothetical protein